MHKHHERTINIQYIQYIQQSKEMKQRDGTHVDHPRRVALFEVEQHGGLVEEGQHGHVLDLVKLGRVLLQKIHLFKCDRLGRNEDIVTKCQPNNQ